MERTVIKSARLGQEMVKIKHPVSYTHLTLPTNREVEISVGAVTKITNTQNNGR